jgi:acyl transferase domain-containing protein
MNRTESVILFPGQGFLEGSMFRSGALGVRYRQVVEEAGAPDSLDLFVLAASVAHYRALSARDGRPAAIVGHSFGELVALVCAGAFTVSQGAEIALQRAAVLDEYQSEPGGMLSVATTRATAERLVRLAGAFRTAIAAENAPAEIVISGTLPGIASVRDRTRAEGIATAPLKARWALHCPQPMLPAAVELMKRLRGLSPRPLAVPVFSPILGRYYRRSDNLTECLARHLMLRVRFADAIRSLWVGGIGSFVECGPLRGLAGSVQQITATLLLNDHAGCDPMRATGPTRDDSAATGSHDQPAFAAALVG